jgi:hypothetical protein
MTDEQFKQLLHEIRSLGSIAAISAALWVGLVIFPVIGAVVTYLSHDPAFLRGFHGG